MARSAGRAVIGRPETIDRSAPSPAAEYLFLGSFSRHFRHIVWRSHGTFRDTDRGAGGASVIC
jgi:hypothetical protein